MTLRLAERESRLRRELEITASLDDGDDATALKQLRKAIAAATRIGWVANWSGGVAAVLDRVERLIDGGRASLILQLCDDLYDRLEEALEATDHSDGEISGLIKRACAIHHAACHAAPPDPMALAEALFTWETEASWDFFAGASETYADVLGKAGVAAYRRLAQAAWDGLKPVRPGVSPAGGDASRRRRIAAILDGFARHDGDFALRVAIRARTLGSADDYLALIALCLEHGESKQALAWAEEGVWQFERDPDIRLVHRAAELRRGAAAPPKTPRKHGGSRT